MEPACRRDRRDEPAVAGTDCIGAAGDAEEMVGNGENRIDSHTAQQVADQTAYTAVPERREHGERVRGDRQAEGQDARALVAHRADRCDENRGNPAEKKE